MKKGDIAERIIKPENCAIGFCIPTSRDDFMKDQSLSNKDFAKKFNGVWGRYDAGIVCYIDKFQPILTRLGVNVVHKLTLERLGELFCDEKLDVIVLFAHWNKDVVEFFDGFAEIPAIIDQIPPGFSGFIDLCVCHPESLTIALRKERPNCLVRFTNKAATPYIWLYFYLELFNYIKGVDVSYLKALEEVITAFFENDKK